MDYLKAFDDFLIDRVFQPVIDFFGWAPLAAARGAVIVGVTLTLGKVGLAIWSDGSIRDVGLAAISLLGSGVLCFGLARAESAGRGARSLIRGHFGTVRLTVVFWVTVYSLSLFVGSHGPWDATWFALVWQMLLGLALYFASCDNPPPPKPWALPQGV